MAAGLSVDLDRWRQEFDELMLRVGIRFARVEPRRRMASFVRGLLAGLPRVNCWSIAEHAGEGGPRGMQRLLSAAVWDEAGVRDDLRGYVLEHFADPGAVLVVDEIGDRTPVLVHNCGDGLKYVTYTKTNVLTGEVYAGRTMGYGDDASILRARDMGHHMTAGDGWGPAQLDKSLYATKSYAGRHGDLSYQAIRGHEQNLIDYFGGPSPWEAAQGTRFRASPTSIYSARFT
jgi:DDE superfamily endonuclease